MKRPTDAPEIEHLIAVCLELFEGRGPGAVDELLAEHPDSSHLVRERLDLLGRLGLVGQPPDEARPDRIGEYVILRVLGRGGMGIVYEARQERPQRHVALKVMRTLPSAAIQNRFRHEAELLGRLQHPGIAQVYEVGTAVVSGMTVPFFAMELVRGQRLDDYATSLGLDVPERLALVARIADAVHHAHQKGIVHRDLKPGNLLVDERGEPRVLDFGIARTMDPDLQLETLRTEVGQLIGTLPYMSPEQAAGDPRAIDSRTDVYSLGVVVYELLTGRLPHELTDKSALEVLKAIQEDDAPRLSADDRTLRGDVETIVAKALAKQKERRYASAAELAADLRRFLNHEPIAARPATALYQLRKFSRRNRALVGGAIAFVLALSLGLVGTLYGMFEAAGERDDAERRFRQANTVLAFQKRMFAAADPAQVGVRVEDLLDRGVLLLEEAENAVDKAALELMLGEAFESIGLYAKAEPLLLGAVAIFERDLGAEDLQTLSARIALAELYVSRFVDLDEADATLAGVEETAARAHGRAHEITLRARLTRCRLEFERQRHSEAVRVAREVLEIAGENRSIWSDAMHRLAMSLEMLSEREEALQVAERLYSWSLARYGKEHPATWSAMNTYGNMLRDAGQVEAGAVLLGEALALRSEHLGPQHPDTINAQSNLAISCTELGELDRAEQLLTEAIAVCEERYPLSHPERLFAMNTLASVFMRQGRAIRAEPLLREVVELVSELRGPEHRDTTVASGNLAKALGYLGQVEEAEALFADVLAIRRETLGDEHVDTLATMTMFGSFLTRISRLDEADLLLHEALEIGRVELGQEDYVVGIMMRRLGANLVGQGRLEEAEAILLEAYEWGERTRPDHPENREVLRALSGIYARTKRPDEVARIQAMLEGEG